MELHGGDFLGAMADPGDGSIIQMAVRDLEVRRESLLAHSIAVILGGDEDAARAKILHGLVGSAVTEFEFEGRGAEGQ